MLKKILLGTLVLVVLGAVVYRMFPSERPEEIQQTQQYGIVDELRKGDIDAALDTSYFVQNSELPMDVKAYAVIRVTSVPYQLSGDIEDALASIRALKVIVVDPIYSEPVRGAALAALALWPRSVSNQAVFNEIFSGELAEKRVPGDREASIRNLLLMSYNMAPTARIGASIAASYAQEVLTTEMLSEEAREELLNQTEHYLAEAEAYADQTISFKDAPAYASYLYWDAYATAVLALHRSGVYKETYRKKFDDALQFLEVASAGAGQWRALTEWRYATMLFIVDNDTVAAKEHLAEAIRVATKSERPETDRLIGLIRGSSDGVVQHPGLLRTMDKSPEFKAFVESVLARM